MAAALRALTEAEFLFASNSSVKSLRLAGLPLRSHLKGGFLGRGMFGWGVSWADLGRSSFEDNHYTALRIYAARHI